MKSLRVATILVIMMCAFNTGWAQSFEPTATSFGQLNDGRLASGFNPTKSNFLAVPAIMGNGSQRDNDTIPISSGMLSAFLPRIPNLELGFLYSFGNRVRTGRFTGDYVLPLNIGKDAGLFGEAHTEYQGFWNKPSVGASNRWDISLGGGYRKLWANDLLVGANGFYDTSRLFEKWYSSGGVGLEMAANISGSDAVDLNINWYGNLFNRDVLVNAFRNKGNSFDLEAGYSHALFNQALDLRLKLAGYQFDVGQTVYGWRTGADLTTRDGVFCLRYDYGQDKINGNYNTVGGFVNIGFQAENLLKGESPFTGTITPTNQRPWIIEYTVRQDYGNFDPEITIMANTGDLVKNIPPDGITGVVVDGEHPRIHRDTFTGTQIGYQGQFTISAPGVTTLVVDIVSSN